MQKKWYKVTFALVLVSVIYLVSATLELAKYKRTLAIGSNLPDVELIHIDGQLFKIKSISNEKHVIVFFSTKCPFCRNKFVEIEKDSRLRSSINFVFVAKNEGENLQEFLNEFPMVRKDEIILIDQHASYLEGFGSSSVPNTFIYRNKKLVKNIKGMFNLKFLFEL